MITGIEIGEVAAKRESKEAITNMKFNINFDDVDVSADKVAVDYTFTALYEGNAEKKIGELTIKGTVLAKEDKKSGEEISSTWKEKKNLPVRFAEDMINLLNFECGARGTLAAYSMGFPAPLPLSRAKLQETKQNKA